MSKPAPATSHFGAFRRLCLCANPKVRVIDGYRKICMRCHGPVYDLESIALFAGIHASKAFTKEAAYAAFAHVKKEGAA